MNKAVIKAGRGSGGEGGLMWGKCEKGAARGETEIGEEWGG